MLASLIVVFREAMEAGLIVGIVLAATQGILGRGRFVASGFAAGLLGAVVIAFFAGSISDMFQGAGQDIGHDFHVLVGMRSKSLARCDNVFIHYA